jgi:ubiquinone/menaquinone biosynthesis C-methylase UbiE
VDESRKLVYDRAVMTTPYQLDYDQIAPTYNRRFADGGQPRIAAALRALAAERNAQRILEIGCGTGHWLAGLTSAAGQVHGLDLSPGMLAQARQCGGSFDLCRGTASRLPYADATFDLLYCVNAIHHFDDPAAFVYEARRLLRASGTLAIVGTDPHTGRDSARSSAWYIYEYFEGTRQMDLARFPSWGTILDWLAAAGFEEAAWRAVDRIHDPKVGRAVLADPFLQKESCSQLALLSDEEYAAGLRRIEAALARAEAAGETIVFHSDLTLHLLTAQAADSR